MAWLLETTGTKAAVSTSVGAVTGANTQETLMLATQSTLVNTLINALTTPYAYVYYAGTYQQNQVFRITLIVFGIKGLLADGSFPLNVPPQGN